MWHGVLLQSQHIRSNDRVSYSGIDNKHNPRTCTITIVFQSCVPKAIYRLQCTCISPFLCFGHRTTKTNRFGVHMLVTQVKNFIISFIKNSHNLKRFVMSIKLTLAKINCTSFVPLLPQLNVDQKSIIHVVSMVLFLSFALHLLT